MARTSAVCALSPPLAPFPWPRTWRTRVRAVGAAVGSHVQQKARRERCAFDDRRASLAIMSSHARGCMCARACVRACVCACVRACVRVRVNLSLRAEELRTHKRELAHTQRDLVRERQELERQEQKLVRPFARGAGGDVRCVRC